MKRSGALAVTTSSICMEIEAASRTNGWLVDQDVSRGDIMHTWSMLRKTEKHFLGENGVNLLGHSHVMGLLWICCPEHVSVHAKELVDRLAGRVEIQARLRITDKKDISEAILGRVREDEDREWRGSKAIDNVRTEEGCWQKHLKRRGRKVE